MALSSSWSLHDGHRDEDDRTDAVLCAPAHHSDGEVDERTQLMPGRRGQARASQQIPPGGLPLPRGLSDYGAARSGNGYFASPPNATSGNHRRGDQFASADSMLFPPTRLTRGMDLRQRAEHGRQGLLQSNSSAFHAINGAEVSTDPGYCIGRGGARIRIKAQKADSFHRLLAKFESLDYDVPENEPYLRRERDYSHMMRSRVNVMRWVVMGLVGIITAIVAGSIGIGIDFLASIKFHYVLKSLERCAVEDCLYEPLLIQLAFVVGFVSVAAFLVVYVEPVAAGSGIPEIKCFLNGVKIPHVVRFKTLLCKAVGILFSVAGGMPVGKEGPMIHSGAVVAAGVSQGRSEFIKADFNVFKQFRLDHEKRDFVSGGAAAGVAAAFGAPVGGVLFALEEGASFWNQSLTWRMFFASMTAVFTLNIILSGYHGHEGDLSYNGLLSFGTFAGRAYYGYELILFVIMGAIGGLIGALFNHINYKLSVMRRRYIKSKFARFMEPILVGTMVASMMFTAVLYSTECHYNAEYEMVVHKPQVFCRDGEFHSLATLVFSLPEEAVKNLFHAPPEVYSITTVFTFAALYFVVACWTYGLGIPSGLFVPCILLGAGVGRGAGALLNLAAPGYFVEPGKYALIGAAATLGGVVRMTISLTVIIVESTGDITYGLPIMLTVMMAKWVGDIFNEGLYDIHIELQGVPLLSWEPPPECITLTAGDVMTTPVDCLQTIARVGEIARLLEETEHNGFPVVEDMHYIMPQGQYPIFGHFRGLILRSQLIILLKRGMFCEADGSKQRHEKGLSLDDFESVYPRVPSIKGLHLSRQMREMLYIDLRPYLNPYPYTVTGSNTMHHVFKPFRALGLRHIVVVNEHYQVVGIVTRKDLARYREVHGLHSDGRIMRLEVL